MAQTPGWLNTLTGRNLLREEVRQVRRALDGVFGEQWLQIGAWGEPGLFRRLARTRRSAVVTAQPMAGADMVCAAEALAIAPDAIDAVFLPHTLELTPDPHALLREVDRILRPDGCLIVLGFNPWGWWGLRHVFSRQGFPPDTQRLVSDGRLHDWLRLLDFRVHHCTYYYFVPPALRTGSPRHVRSSRATEAVEPLHPAAPETHAVKTRGLRIVPPGPKSAPFSRALDMLSHRSVFAGCYILVARKETCIVTPIRPRWKRRSALVTGLAGSTTRNAA